VSRPLSTGCQSLDSLLGGGFERGTVTQVYGPPAAGKTNIMLSAALHTAAADSMAIYVDTEGISSDRFRQIANGVTDELSSADRESLTSQVMISDAHDFEAQAVAVRDTAEFAHRADIIILDSATGFYRLQRTLGGTLENNVESRQSSAGSTENTERTENADDGDTLRRLTTQITHLLSLARKHDLAVVITNQVFTDPDTDRVRPLGGYTLEHWTGTVLRLERFRGGKRRATLEKHRSKPTGESETFVITDSGVADNKIE
jgi:DNA repair and recombination protein RadB